MTNEEIARTLATRAWFEHINEMRLEYASGSLSTWYDRAIPTISFDAFGALPADLGLRRDVVAVDNKEVTR